MRVLSKMTVMLKKWYRSKKYLVITLIIVLFCFLYYTSLGDGITREPDLDLTRKIMPEASNVCSSVMGLSYRDNRESVMQYIENKLQEALKEDKGTGCDIPHLDPFAKEVTQFDKELPKVVCTGKDWVKCFLSECKVIPEILSNTKDITCTYRDIIYHSDHEYVLGPPVDVHDGDVYRLTRSDHVKIKCVGTHVHSILPSRWSGHSLGFRSTVKTPKPPRGREDTLNILIFGFDSTSKNGFIRRMPKSYKFVTEELKGYVMDGYGILGDGTPAALFPILTGKNELELPDVRKKSKNNLTLDCMPFLFNKMKEDGYRTAYFEDMPWIGTFQYRFNGFLHQPADHYLRSFYLEESNRGKKWWSNRNKYCVGDTPQYELMMNITDQFFRLDGKKFCFTFIADITHDDINMISTADDATVNFLKLFKQQGRLDNTLLFVMGDHGPRYSKVRNTLQGKLEERLPLMVVIPPTKLANKPHIIEALTHNRGVLTTPHDIYATVLDALNRPDLENHYTVKGADLRRGLSLFNPIPSNRSCSSAGIEPHWCACLRWHNVSHDDPLYSRAVNALLQYINELTEVKRSVCVPRTLLSVEWVMRAHADSKMLSFIEAKDADGYVGKFGPQLKEKTENWQIKISVGPGEGIYEASLTYVKDKDKFLIESRDISRTNAYNDEPSCISATHPHLNKYCYCKTHT